jgi:tetratricopeptide (TPR) repeat protein/tRNA A-37 threonylcarbamoyl transferase component Bud32
MRMNVCPSSESLENFLAGGLAEAAADSIRAHLHDCARCQTLLDQLSDDPELRQWLSRAHALGSESDEGPALRKALDDLHHTPTESVAEDTLPVAPGSPLCFLEPPIQEGDLGMLGPYRVQAELGRGGMGIVFRAYHDALRRTVALKLLRPELADTRARARLVREAQITAQFQHDHVVTIHAVVDPPNALPYLVMEYLAGPTISALIRAQQRLESRQAVALAVQVADGLAAAHEAGLVHRDIKPSNIMLDPTTGRAKIMDFGLARIVAQPSTLTREGALAGTPAYMSPEQVREPAAADLRTDVYSLGVVLYEALTGEVPFRGTPHLVLQQVLHDDPRPLRQLNDRIPRDLETICLKAMAKEPQRRYQTACALAEDLRRWQRGEPIQARPASALERCWRWCRRSPRVAGLTVALVIVLAGGFAGVVWQWQRAERNFREKLQQQQLAEQSAQQARDAVHEFYTKVSEETLLNEPGLQPLRKQLLQTALSYYQRFADEHGGDAAARAELAKALGRIAAITNEMDRKADALAPAQQAVTIWEQLLHEHPDESEYQQQLATSLQSLSGLLRDNGDTANAEKGLERAQTLLVQLAHHYPENRDDQRNLAVSYRSLAELYHLTSRPKKAESVFRQAIDRLEELTQAHPQEADYRRDLAICYYDLGSLFWSVRTYPEAQAAFGKAVAILEPLTQSQPGVVSYQLELAKSHHGLVMVHSATGELSAGERAYLASREVWEKLVRANPAVTLYRRNLAQVNNNLGLVYALTGQIEPSQSAYDQAVRQWQQLSRDHPTVLEFAVGEAMTFYNLGNLLRDSDQTEKALDCYGSAERNLAAVLQREPRHVNARALLWSLHGARAIASSQLGRHAEAIPDWDAFLEYGDGQLPHLSELMRALAQARAKRQDLSLSALADHRAVAAEAQAFIDKMIPPGGVLYVLAHVYALCTTAALHDAKLTSVERDKLAQDYAARAVAALLKAQKTGYFGFTANRERLKRESAFDPLRMRPDFRTLLEESQKTAHAVAK